MKLQSLIAGAIVGIALLANPVDVAFGQWSSSVELLSVSRPGEDEVLLLDSGLGADQSIVGEIVEAAEGLAERVDFAYGPDLDAVWMALDWIAEHRGDLLINSHKCVCWHVEGEVHYVELAYLGSPEEIPRMRDEIEGAIDEALSWAPPTASQAERAKALHDYVVRNCSYDYFNYENGTIPDSSYAAYGVLCSMKKGVCTGYARAYGMLLHFAGINSTVISSDDMEHSWNAVEIDGRWYHADSCWADPVSYSTGQDGGFKGEVRDDYFLKSDAAIADHYGWRSPVSCDSTRFDSVKWASYDRPWPLHKFTDIDPEAWYVESLSWAASEGALAGSGGLMMPNRNMTRGEAAAMLYNLFGQGRNVEACPMRDVSASSWYYEPVSWAVEEGVMAGYGNGLFGADDALTREQFAAILMRLTDGIGFYDVSKILALKDRDAISPYARKEVLVAFSWGILNGSDGYLRPRDPLKRSEAGAMLKNAFDAGYLEL